MGQMSHDFFLAQDWLLSLSEDQIKPQIESLLEKILIVFNELEVNQLDLTGQLEKWKKSNSKPEVVLRFDDKLLQSQLESHFASLWDLRNQLKSILNFCQARNFQGTNNEIFTLLERVQFLIYQLFSHALIIEKQPPQVIRTKTFFDAKIRLLFNPNVIGTQCKTQQPPRICVSLIDERQAREWHASNYNPLRQLADLQNREGMLLTEKENDNQLIGNLTKMKILGRVARERHLYDQAQEEKFGLLFQVEVALVGGGGGEPLPPLTLTAWTLSHPVVIISNDNQRAKAAGTIFWHNAFVSTQDRELFSAPDSVSWQELSQSLSQKFSLTFNGKFLGPKSLSASDLSFLGELVTQRPNEKFPAPTNMVAWSQFNQARLPGCKFTFWEWFYAAVKLIENQLIDFWIENSIIFASRKNCAGLLRSTPPGTFIIRFVENLLGSIQIVYTGNEIEEENEIEGNDQMVESRKVHFMDPLDARHLRLMPLEKFLKSYSHLLINCYPAIPK